MWGRIQRIFCCMRKKKKKTVVAHDSYELPPENVSIVFEEGYLNGKYPDHFENVYMVPEMRRFQRVLRFLFCCCYKQDIPVDEYGTCHLELMGKKSLNPTEDNRYFSSIGYVADNEEDLALHDPECKQFGSLANDNEIPLVVHRHQSPGKSQGSKTNVPHGDDASLVSDVKIPVNREIDHPKPLPEKFNEDNDVKNSHIYANLTEIKEKIKQPEEFHIKNLSKSLAYSTKILITADTEEEQQYTKEQYTKSPVNSLINETTFSPAEGTFYPTTSMVRESNEIRCNISLYSPESMNDFVDRNYMIDEMYNTYVYNQHDPRNTHQLGRTDHVDIPPHVHSHATKNILSSQKQPFDHAPMSHTTFETSSPPPEDFETYSSSDLLDDHSLCLNDYRDTFSFNKSSSSSNLLQLTQTRKKVNDVLNIHDDLITTQYANGIGNERYQYTKMKQYVCAATQTMPEKTLNEINSSDIGTAMNDLKRLPDDPMPFVDQIQVSYPITHDTVLMESSESLSEIPTTKAQMPVQTALSPDMEMISDIDERQSLDKGSQSPQNDDVSSPVTEVISVDNNSQLSPAVSESVSSPSLPGEVPLHDNEVSLPASLIPSPESDPYSPVDVDAELHKLRRKENNRLAAKKCRANKKKRKEQQIAIAQLQRQIISGRKEVKILRSQFNNRIEDHMKQFFDFGDIDSLKRQIVAHADKHYRYARSCESSDHIKVQADILRDQIFARIEKQFPGLVAEVLSNIMRRRSTTN